MSLTANPEKRTVKTRLLSRLGETLINNAITLYHALCLKLNLGCTVLCPRTRKCCANCVCVCAWLCASPNVCRSMELWLGRGQAVPRLERSAPGSFIPPNRGLSTESWGATTGQESDSTYLCTIIDRWQRKRQMRSNGSWASVAQGGL